jgi:hypothetical protein
MGKESPQHRIKGCPLVIGFHLFLSHLEFIPFHFLKQIERSNLPRSVTRNRMQSPKPSTANSTPTKEVSASPASAKREVKPLPIRRVHQVQSGDLNRFRARRNIALRNSDFPLLPGTEPTASDESDNSSQDESFVAASIFPTRPYPIDDDALSPLAATSSAPDPAQRSMTWLYTQIHNPYGCVISAMYSDDPDLEYRVLCSKPRITWNAPQATTSDSVSEPPASVDDDWRTLPFSGQSTRPPSEPADGLDRSNSVNFTTCTPPPPAPEDATGDEFSAGGFQEDPWVAQSCSEADRYILDGTYCSKILFTEPKFVCGVQIRRKEAWFHSYYPFPEGSTVVVQQEDEQEPLDHALGFDIGTVTFTSSLSSPSIRAENPWRRTGGLTVLGRANERALRRWTNICQTQGIISKKLFPASTEGRPAPILQVEGRLDGTCWTITVEPSLTAECLPGSALHRRAKEEFPTLNFRIVAA